MKFQLRQQIEKGLAMIGYKTSAVELEEWLKTCSFEEWLEIATGMKIRLFGRWVEYPMCKLAAPARQRIKNEIEAHYAEAVTAHMAAGQSEISARAAALAELGDPQIAALNFRISHLTEFEAKWMRWMERTATKPLFTFWMLPVDIMPLGGLLLLSLQEFRIIALLGLIAFAGLRLIPRLLYAKGLPRTLFLKELALSNFIAIAPVAFAFALSNYHYPTHHVHGFFDIVFDVAEISGMLGFFWFWGFYFNPGFQVWNKLRKMGDEQNELPPHQTPVS